MSRRDFIIHTHLAAKESGHIFPAYATCEAALESAFGSSLLAIGAFNLFGVKVHRHSEYGTMSLPTKEFLDNKWLVVHADWVKYPDLPACFTDRMDTLNRLKDKYSHYKAALEAPNGETFINEVSKSWSTDPLRGQKVLDIYKQFSDCF